MCTLKNFPYKIEHTIQWSRDLFEGLFSQTPHTLLAYRNDPHFWNSCSDPVSHDEAVRALHEVLVSGRCETPAECVGWAAHLFDKLFRNEIAAMIRQFPVGAVSLSQLERQRRRKWQQILERLQTLPPRAPAGRRRSPRVRLHRRRRQIARAIPRHRVFPPIQ